MATIEVSCYYYKECCGKSTATCKKCVNNRLRNKEINYFEEAHDNPIPDPNPRVTYTGPAEQTAGYKCPVCGEFTSPYHIKDSRCGSCGFKLNTY
jgi:hypothetical protein